MSSTSRNRARAGQQPPADSKTPAAESGVSGLEAHLGYWLRIVSNHVSYAFRAKVEQHGVTVAEWVLLRTLFDGDGVKPSALATTLGLTRGAISKLVDRLLAKDLVTVRADPLDGRAQLVFLKAAGKRLVPKLAVLADQNDAEAFGGINQEERVCLLATLKGLVERHDLRAAPVE